MSSRVTHDNSIKINEPVAVTDYIKRIVNHKRQKPIWIGRDAICSSSSTLKTPENPRRHIELRVAMNVIYFVNLLEVNHIGSIKSLNS